MTKKRIISLIIFYSIVIPLLFLKFQKYISFEKKSVDISKERSIYKNIFYSIFTKLQDPYNKKYISDESSVLFDIDEFLVKRRELKKINLFPDLKNKIQKDLSIAIIQKFSHITRDKIENLQDQELEYVFVKSIPFYQTLFSENSVNFIPKSINEKINLMYKEKRSISSLTVKNLPPEYDVDITSDYFKSQVNDYLSNLEFYKKIRLIVLTHNELNDMDLDYINTYKNKQKSQKQTNLSYQEKDFFIFYLNNESKDFIEKLKERNELSIEKVLNFYQKNSFKYIKKNKESIFQIMDYFVGKKFVNTKVKEFSEISKDLGGSEFIIYIDNVYINKDLIGDFVFSEIKVRNAKKIYDSIKQHSSFSIFSKNKFLNYRIVDIFCDKLDQCKSDATDISDYIDLGVFSKNDIKMGYSKIILDEKKKNFFAYEIDEIAYYQNSDSFYRSNKARVNSIVYDIEYEKNLDYLINAINDYINSMKYKNNEELLYDLKNKYKVEFDSINYEVDLNNLAGQKLTDDCINNVFMIKKISNSCKCGSNLVLLNNIYYDDSLFDLNLAKGNIYNLNSNFSLNLITSIYADLDYKFKNSLNDWCLILQDFCKILYIAFLFQFLFVFL